MNTPHHPSLEAMAAMFVIAALALTVAIILAGCAISLPVPPSGPDMGKYGSFKIGYEPNYLTTPFLDNNTTKGLTK
jgi:hypothetical protein